jgi:hypothetical protein
MFTFIGRASLRPFFLWPPRSILVGIVLTILSGLSACAPSIRGGPDVVFTNSQDIDALRFSSDGGAIQRYFAAGTNIDRQMIRNDIVLGRIYIIDLHYSQFEQELTRERQDVGFYSAIALLGLNSTGTLVGGASTKAVLHAISAGLVGAKEAYSKEILIEKTIDILQKNMRATRLELKTRMISALSRPVTQYPLQLALSDLDAYYSAGTITGAFLGASKQASVRLEDVEIEAQAVRANIFSRSSTGDRIRAFVRQSTDNRDRAIAWLGANAGGVPWATFTRSAKYRGLHMRMIGDLGIP